MSGSIGTAVKAFLFDLDGVIADTHAAHARSWQRLAEEHWLALSPATFRRMLGRTRADSLAILLEGRRVDRITISAMLARKQELFLRELEAMDSSCALPGARELAAAARTEGIALALVSSSCNGARMLHRVGLADLFDVVIDGNSGLATKPAPDLFLEAATRLGVSPASVVVIEDSPAGIEGARKGGFRLVSVGPETLSGSHLPSLAGATPALIRRVAA